MKPLKEDLDLFEAVIQGSVVDTPAPSNPSMATFVSCRKCEQNFKCPKVMFTVTSAELTEYMCSDCLIELILKLTTFMVNMYTEVNKDKDV